MDGVLDARFDHLPVVPPKLSAPLPWVKFTIACFRFNEVASYFEDEGWTVRPLLVVRDARSVFNSLIKKSYGRNGITADDPPLRLRLRRFLQDWQLFRDRGWPMLRYEDFAADPVKGLRHSCDQMQLPWHDAMASWPKRLEEIAEPGFGNETFVLTRARSLAESIRSSLAQIKTDNIPRGDLDWIETEFHEMNQAMGYPEHVPSAASTSLPERAIPRFENTRRCERLRRKHRVSLFLKDAGRGFSELFKRHPISPPRAQTIRPTSK